MIEIQQQLRQQQQDLQEAVADLNDWVKDISKKEDALKKKTVMTPDLPPVRGTVPVEVAAKSKPETPAAQENPITRFKDLGNEFFKKSKYKEAIEAYTKGIALDPKGFETHVLYGNRCMAYLKSNMWKEAEVDATVSVELNRVFTKGYFRRGTARVELGKMREALEDFERVLVLEPTNGEAKIQLEAVKAKLPKPASGPQPGGASSTAAPTRKKLIVQEVDDDDDDEAEPQKATTAAEKTAPPPPPPPSPPKPVLTQTQIDAVRRAEEAHRQVEAARKAEEDSRKRQEQEAQKRRDAQRKMTNSRVEVLEDDDEVVAPAVAATAAPPVKKPSATKVEPRADLDLPVITLEKLKPPKTYLEFEKTHHEIAQQSDKDDLFAAYLKMIDVTTFKPFFKSNLSSPVLRDILAVCANKYDAPYALKVLQELLKVNRADDLLMFSEKEEKAFLKSVFEKLATAVASGSIDKAVVEKLRATYTDLVTF